jgi:site-specific DNA-methyltransferase (adenine-specific)
MKNTYKIINGDSYEELKKFPDNYFDSVITDPPYGLGKEPNAEEVLKAWTSVGYLEVKGSGFMGKEWDAFVPQPLFWKEVFRVLKHGGHVVAFFGTRTYDWGVMAMRLGGFEIRDCIQWLYGSGFPKSHNISKAIDKMYGAEREIGELKFKGGTQLGVINDDNWKPKDVYESFSATDQAKQWNGWGSALKPANEPIVLARKPLEKGLSIAENVLKWGTGAINIDGCRIGTEGATQRSHQSEYPKKENGTEDRSGHWARVGHNIEQLNKGRFPANLILTHHPECECKGLKKVEGSNCSPEDIGKGREGNFSNGIYGEKQSKITSSYTDSEGKEIVEDWTCHDDCPIKIMDEQSGLTKSRIGKERGTEKKGLFANSDFNKVGTEHNDEGGASRFFYVAKASKSERNFGNEKNFHPTVKPVKLMQYLVKMITPPNGKVLDPFNGSGTTGIACTLENLEYTGIELDADYCKISEARITNWSEIDEYEQYKLLTQEDEEPISKIIQTKLFE